MFKPITLESRDELVAFLEVEDFQISDISFGNLFIWSVARNIEYANLESNLVIKTTYKNESPFFFYPIGNNDKKKTLLALKEYLKNENLACEFRSIESKNIEPLKEVFTNLESTSNIDDFDYVYSVNELIELSGRKFHKKKNHLNQFLITYENKWRYEKLDSSNADEVYNEFCSWFSNTPNPSLGLINEKKGIELALKNYQALDFKGGVIRVEDKIVAFSFGEVISKDMAIIHIEKADSNYLGAYQIINQQLIKNEFSNLSYINREQDLGIEGLRRAKKSYNPIFMVEKFIVK